MPYGSYNHKKLALSNAKKIIKETGCDAVKLEGGHEIKDIIKYLVQNNINVMGHIGLLPQKVRKKSDYKAKGNKKNDKTKIIKDLHSITSAGVFSIVLEAVKIEIANEIVNLRKVPIIGIGASKNCDGQILVLEDLLGYFQKVPKFVKKYMNFQNEAKKSIKKYSNDVRKKYFPTKKNIYF